MNFVRKIIKCGTCYVVYFGCQNKTLSTQINQKQLITISSSMFPLGPTSIILFQNNFLNLDYNEFQNTAQIPPHKI